MVPNVTLIVTRGPLAGQKYVFTEATAQTIGRSRDCTICLPLETEHLDISRHHCQVEIAPPAILVRDLGSLNGTYVNGRKIGQRTRHEVSPSAGGKVPPAVMLTDGDELQLGEHTAFRVCVFPPTPRPSTARTQRPSSGELRQETVRS